MPSPGQVLPRETGRKDSRKRWEEAKQEYDFRQSPSLTDPAEREALKCQLHLRAYLTLSKYSCSYTCPWLRVLRGINTLRPFPFSASLGQQWARSAQESQGRANGSTVHRWVEMGTWAQQKQCRRSRWTTICVSSTSKPAKLHGPWCTWRTPRGLP